MYSFPLKTAKNTGIVTEIRLPILAGTPANRTQLPVYGGDNGFEDREGHQPPNHSHMVMDALILGN